MMHRMVRDAQPYRVRTLRTATNTVLTKQVRIGGGGGSRGSGPPLLCHDVGFLTLGPKLDPHLAPLFCL